MWLAEVEAWQRTASGGARASASTIGGGSANLRRKSGNIEDFVTRWGGGYGYMMVLDADSLMSARSMIGLLERMDANPQVGLIQAPPKLIRGRTLFARVLQFAGEALWPAVGRRHQLLGHGRGQLLGPQRDHPHRPVRRSCAACRCCRAGRRSAARS